jgi:hypothetical protein
MTPHETHNLHIVEWYIALLVSRNLVEMWEKWSWFILISYITIFLARKYVFLPKFKLCTLQKREDSDSHYVTTMYPFTIWVRFEFYKSL